MMLRFRHFVSLCGRALHFALSFATRKRTLLWWRLPLLIWIGIALVLLGAVISFQSYQADTKLHVAQKSDTSGQYSQAQKELAAINQFAVWPGIRNHIRIEWQRNQQLLTTAQKLAQVQQLLKEHKTQAAQDLLQSITKDAGGYSAIIQSQVAQLQKNVQSQSSQSSSSPSHSSGSSGSSSGSGAGGGGSSSGGGGGSGGTPPPGPMSAITINSFSPSASPRTASTCTLSEAVNFGVNGSGSVKVTWKQVSSKTSSAIDNPVTYSFSAAGSQTDTTGTTLQGLEPGDSYRVSVTITDTADGNITTTAGPVTFSTCASPQSLQTPGQQSFMTQSVTPLTVTAAQNADSLFSNECNMNFQSSFSVNGPGSIQVVYTVTSASSIGATLYSIQQEDFTGPGTASDSSYIRMPHLPGRGSYTITAEFNVLGDPAHSASTGPVTSACD